MSIEFKFHTLNEGGIGKAQAIAYGFDELLTKLERLCADGRELSIVKTKLEEACYFAKQAMARCPLNEGD